MEVVDNTRQWSYLRGDISICECILLKSAVRDRGIPLADSDGQKFQSSTMSVRKCHQHSIAQRQVLNALAQLFHRAGKVRPENNGVFGNEKSISLHLPIEGIERGCVNFDQDLTRTRSRYWNGANDEVCRLRG